MTPDLTVAVFAYNEEANVRVAVSEILEELQRLPATWELVFIDDGSADRTGAIAEEIAAAEPRVRVVRHGENRGLGGAYRSGFEHARGRLLTFFPADGQFPPSIIGDFFRRIDGKDMVLGYLPPHRRPPLARLASAAERVLYRALLGRMPRFQGILMFRRAILDEVPLVSQGRGWAVIMELVWRAGRGGYRIESAPTELRPRLSGESKVMNRRAIAANLKQLFALRRATRADS